MGDGVHSDCRQHLAAVEDSTSRSRHYPATFSPSEVAPPGACTDICNTVPRRVIPAGIDLGRLYSGSWPRSRDLRSDGTRAETIHGSPASSTGDLGGKLLVGADQSFDSWPDWIRSTSTFHSSRFSTARLPVSPILISSPTISTSGHAVHAGHSDIFRLSISCPPACLVVLLRHGLAAAAGRCPIAAIPGLGSFATRPHTRSWGRGTCTPRPSSKPSFLTSPSDDCRATLPRRAPALHQCSEAITHLHEVREPPVEFVSLSPDKVADVVARSASRSLDGDDLLDLVQGEAESLRLPDEREERQRVGSVHAIARRGAAGSGKDTRRLIQPQRLPACAAFLLHLTDHQAVSSHDRSLNPAPWGKVKEKLARLGCPCRHRVTRG